MLLEMRASRIVPVIALAFAGTVLGVRLVIWKLQPVRTSRATAATRADKILLA